MHTVAGHAMHTVACGCSRIRLLLAMLVTTEVVAASNCLTGVSLPSGLHNGVVGLRQSPGQGWPGMAWHMTNTEHHCNNLPNLASMNHAYL